MKITIFGFAGTGTSTTGNLLAQQLGYEFKSSGNIFREFAESAGLSIYDFEKLITNDSTYKYDLELDKKVLEYGEKNDCFVFESRLAWHFIPDSVKIKLVCDPDLSYKRVSQREGITFEEAKAKTLQRAADVEKRYLKVYPEIDFPPKDEVFDLVVDTDELTPDEVVLTIVNFLESRKKN